jgi:nucleotide-binding universal stress UspA family protein
MGAADYGIALAKKDDAKLVVVNVIHTPASTLVHTKQAWFDEFLKKAKSDAEEWFNKIRKDATENGVVLETKLIGSDPSIVGSIVDYAEGQNVDLIIVGTKGRTGLKKIMLGSIASGIVTYAHCPVMVVK